MRRRRPHGDPRAAVVGGGHPGDPDDRRRRHRLLAGVPHAGRAGRLARVRRSNRYGLQSGVLLRRAGALPDTSLLLDGTPSAPAGWDADLQDALPVGSPVSVAGGHFSIEVQSVTAAGAVVRVTPSAPAAAAAAAPAPAAPQGVVLPGGGRHGSATWCRRTAPVAPRRCRACRWLRRVGPRGACPPPRSRARRGCRAAAPGTPRLAPAAERTLLGGPWVPVRWAPCSCSALAFVLVKVRRIFAL